MLRAERLVRNQALCRDANEEVRRAAGRFSDPAEDAAVRFDFLCECVGRHCAALVSMSVGEYEEVRRESATFVVTPGHEDESVEEVVRREGSYVVVRKFHPEPIRAASELDPRRPRPSAG